MPAKETYEDRSDELQKRLLGMNDLRKKQGRSTNVAECGNQTLVA